MRLSKYIIRKLTMPLAFLAPISVFSNERVLEEVVVTAQKRAESLQDVPASVSAVDSSFMNEAALTDVDEIVQYTPNVNFRDGIGISPIMTMRGYGTPPGTVGGLEPSIGLIIDDVPYGRATYINDAVFDLERIEVLRGPQGTLFGKNTVAGVFNFTTRDASFEGDGRINLAAGSRDSLRGDIAQSFTLIEDRLAARIAIRYKEEDSANNTFTGTDGDVSNTGWRTKIKWLINETSELDLHLWASKSDTVGYPYQSSSAPERVRDTFKAYDPEWEDNEFNDTLSHNIDGYIQRNTESISLKYFAEIPDFSIFNAPTLTAISAYSNIETEYLFDGDFSPISFIEYQSIAPETFEQTHLELRFDASVPVPFGIGEEIETMIGFFHSDSDVISSTANTFDVVGLAAMYNAGFPVAGTGSTPIQLPPEVIALLLSGQSLKETHGNFTTYNSTTSAVFSQFTWIFNAEWSVTLGFRYGEDTRSGAVDVFSTGNTNLTGPLLGIESFTRSLKDTETDFSSKIAISWQPNDTVTFYGGVSEGFKSGGYVSGVYQEEKLTFEPEESISAELGFKSELFDRSLRLNGAIYYSEFSNLQVINFDGTGFFASNADLAVSQGIELDFLWLTPLPWLTVGGSAGYTDAYYDTYYCQVPDRDGQADNPPHSSCGRTAAATQSTDVRFRDASGDRLPYAPDWNGALYLNAGFPVTDNLRLIAGLDILAQGESDIDQEPGRLEPTITKFNARLGLVSHAGWSVIVNGKNLTGEEERYIGTSQPGAPETYLAFSDDDTLFSIDISYEY